MSKLSYRFNSLILKVLPKRCSQKYLLYLRMKKDDTLMSSRVSRDVLTPKEHSEVNEFWSRFYNIRHTAHEYYTQITGKFYKEYIPNSLWKRIIDPYFNDWKLAHYMDNKCYYHRMFTVYGVKQPDLVAYRLNNIWFDSNDEVITWDSVVEKSMNAKECFIKKAVESWGGSGVYYFSSVCETKEKLQSVINSLNGDLVIQEGVKQCEALAKVNTDSVNTIRVLSFLKMDGSVLILSSVLRMGVKGAKVDNASNGGIVVGIQDNGRLKDVAYNIDGDVYTEHPSSHVILNNIEIPQFHNILNIIKRTHPKFPHFRLVAWDFAIDRTETPVLIEVNFNDAGLESLQLTNGPVFGSRTEEILSEVFLKK